MTDELTKARAQIAVLRGALNGMMVFYGMDEDRDNGACAVTWDRARQALAATPSDCLKQIRAEILDEAFDALPEENFKFVDRDKIKAVFEKLKQL